MWRIKFVLFRARARVKKLVRRRKMWLIVILGVLLFAYLVPPKHDVATKINNDTIVVKHLSQLKKIRAIFAGVSQSTSGNNSGILPQNVIPTVSREKIRLVLTSEEFTAIVNEAKPVYVPLGNIRVEFRNGIIYASALSFIPIVPGTLSGSMRVSLDPFTRLPQIDIIDGYLLRVLLSEKQLHFIDINGESLTSKVLREYQVDVLQLQIAGNKMVVSAVVPQGIIQRQGEKLVLDLTKKPARR